MREYLWLKSGHKTLVYTDASKNPDNEQAEVADVIPNMLISRKIRTLNEFSAFSEELIALMMAVRWISEAGLKDV